MYEAEPRMAGRGRSRRGATLRGSAWLPKVRRVLTCPGAASPGGARPDSAPLGRVRRDTAPLCWSRLGALRRGGASLVESRLVMSRHGQAWPGTARPGSPSHRRTRHDAARQDQVWPVQVWRGAAYLGSPLFPAWFGGARRGESLRGESRLDVAGRGKTRSGKASLLRSRHGTATCGGARPGLMRRDWACLAKASLGLAWLPSYGSRRVPARRIVVRPGGAGLPFGKAWRVLVVVLDGTGRAVVRRGWAARGEAPLGATA